jgi:hypothetical protein
LDNWTVGQLDSWQLDSWQLAVGQLTVGQLAVGQLAEKLIWKFGNEVIWK